MKDKLYVCVFSLFIVLLPPVLEPQYVLQECVSTLHAQKTQTTLHAKLASVTCFVLHEPFISSHWLSCSHFPRRCRFSSQCTVCHTLILS